MKRVASTLLLLVLSIGCDGDSPTTPGPAVASPPVVTLAQLSLDPSTIVGGQESKGTVTLEVAAPAGGVVVALSSSTQAAMIPASVTVAPGSASATFAITTQSVSSTTDITVVAAIGSASKSATLRLTVPQPKLVALGVNSPVLGGQSATGRVQLDLPAPPGGALVALTADDTAARVEGGALIPEGRQSIEFTFPTRAVTSDVRITIVGSYGGASSSATLTVLSGTSPTPPAPSPIPMFFSYVSSPGHYIGQGRTVIFNYPGAPFYAFHSCGRVGQIRASIDYPLRSYTVSFFVPGGLKVGSYPGAVSWGDGRGQPEMEVTGDGSACKAVGRFEITQVELGPGGAVRRFRATFEHHCDTIGSPALQGEISLNDPPIGGPVICQ